jgi:hypothetical protein
MCLVDLCDIRDGTDPEGIPVKVAKLKRGGMVITATAD